MLNPIEKFKRSILHPSRYLHHWLYIFTKLMILALERVKTDFDHINLVTVVVQWKKWCFGPHVAPLCEPNPQMGLLFITVRQCHVSCEILQRIQSKQPKVNVSLSLWLIFSNMGNKGGSYYFFREGTKPHPSHQCTVQRQLVPGLVFCDCPKP